MYSKSGSTNGRFFLTLMMGLGTMFAYAQQNLSLDDAIARALANNYQVQVARAAVAVAENNDSWALTGRYPGVEVSIASGNSYTGTNNPASVVVESGVIANGLTPGIATNPGIVQRIPCGIYQTN
ncbi:MAG: TolC family protein [Saprospiraceae bacterium]